MKSRYLAFCAVLVSCSGSSPSPPESSPDATTAPDAAPSEHDAEAAPDAEPTSADAEPAETGSGIGAACERPLDVDCTRDFRRVPEVSGTCTTGQICILPTCAFVDTRAVNYEAWTGGYCTQTCAGSNGHPDSAQCPLDAICSSSDRGEMQQCLHACTLDSDCRGDEGYTCQIDGLGAYADLHLPAPRGTTHSCRPDNACARSGDEPSAGFVNQPVPFAPDTVAAGEGNVVFNGTETAVLTYIGYRVRNGAPTSNNVVAVGCTLGADKRCTWTAPAVQEFDAHGTALIGFVTDPSVAVDAVTGEFYWAWLDYVEGGHSWLRVARSSDGGQTWSVPADAATEVVDKPWVVARGGTVWAFAVDTMHTLRIARSLDRGQTWTQHRLGVANEWTFYPQPAVDANGNLFVAWNSERPARTAREVTNSIRVGVWPAGAPCAEVPAMEDCFLGKIAAAQGLEFSEDEPDDVPHAAALNPADGSFWVSYVRGDRYRATDIDAVRCEMSMSAAGMTCGAPVRVSQPGAASTCGVRILPAIAFDEAGVAHAAWLDGRYGAGDRGRLWYARSADGVAWEESVLSDDDSVFTVGKEWSAGWGGDYIGLTAGGGRVLATWSDSRALAPTGIQPGGFVRQRMFLGVR